MNHGANQPMGAGGPSSWVLGGRSPPSIFTGKIFSIHSSGKKWSVGGDSSPVGNESLLSSPRHTCQSTKKVSPYLTNRHPVLRGCPCTSGVFEDLSAGCASAMSIFSTMLCTRQAHHSSIPDVGARSHEGIGLNHGASVPVVICIWLGYDCARFAEA